MLAPGEYLIKPPTTVSPSSPTPIMTPALLPTMASAVRSAEQSPFAPAAPAGEPEESGFRRFLLTLLRALGAVHS